MKNYFFLLTILLSTIFSTCKKKEFDVLTENKNGCLFNHTELAINYDTFFTMGCPVMFDAIHLNKYEYFDPVFNPNDKNEIAYVRKDTEFNSGWHDELWTFNFCTGETNFLTDKIGYDPDWSIKDWIIFTGKDRQIWKIKPSGDSLTQLTNQSGYSNHPKWNDTGNKFVYFNANSDKSLFLIADEFGFSKDTLPLFAAHWNWSANYILFSRGGGSSDVIFGVYDLETKDTIVIGSPPNNRIVGELNYIENKNSLLYNEQVIAYVNFDTKEETKLLIEAANRIYGRMDLSSDDKTIIVTRTYRNKINSCTMEVETSLYLVDIDGKNERRINFPE